jgi:hypothetical protein
MNNGATAMTYEQLLQKVEELAETSLDLVIILTYLDQRTCRLILQ